MRESALDKIRKKFNGGMPMYSETEVQSSVIEWYEKDGWEVVKIIQTTKNGWPDVQCHKKGVTVFIECKATGKAKNFPSRFPLQHYRHEVLRSQGFTVLVIDTKL